MNFFSVMFMAFSFVFPSFCSSISLPSTKCKGIDIYYDSRFMDNVGYNNHHSSSNGELSVIKKLIKDGDVVFDIGASRGDWSAYVFSNHNFVSLYAFEPIPNVYELLEKSFRNKNGLAYNLAFSNHIGERLFYYYADNYAHSRLSGFYDRKILKKRFRSKPEEIVVHVDTLDNFCFKNGINKIDFLKIDTEGEELNVLKGASDLLANKAISIMQFEYGGCYIDSKSTLYEVYNLLLEYGYFIFRIIPKGLLEISNWRDELENYKYSNYLAVAS